MFSGAFPCEVLNFVVFGCQFPSMIWVHCVFRPRYGMPLVASVANPKSVAARDRPLSYKSHARAYIRGFAAVKKILPGGKVTHVARFGGSQQVFAKGGNLYDPFHTHIVSKFIFQHFDFISSRNLKLAVPCHCRHR